MQALLDAIARTPMPTDACRVFHGRGGLYPGCEQWTLDAFPPVWLVTSFQPVDEAELVSLHEALSARWAQLNPGEPLSWVFQYRHEARAETRLMAGSVPEPHVVSEDGATFRVHLLRGLNHGFFVDMAEGRRRVRELVAARPGAKVLNLFAYTCSFSVVALLAGARQVTNVDMSDGALAIGKRNHIQNGLTGGELPAPRHLQLVGKDHPRRALRSGGPRPAQLPEGQLRRREGTFPETILSQDNEGLYRWYAGGKMNTCYLAVDRHVIQGNGSCTALIYDSPVTGIKKQYTYDQLLEEVSKFWGTKSQRSQQRRYYRDLYAYGTRSGHCHACVCTYWSSSFRCIWGICCSRTRHQDQ